MSYAQAKRIVKAKFPDACLKVATTATPKDRSYEYKRETEVEGEPIVETVKVDPGSTISKMRYYTVLNAPEGLSLHGKHTFRSVAKAWIAAAHGLR